MVETVDIKKLVSEKFSDRSITSIDEDEVGGSHNTHFVKFDNDDEVVVKTSEEDLDHLPEVERGFEIEAQILEFVDEETDLPVPKVYFADTSRKQFDFRYLITEKLRGKNLKNFHDYPQNKNLYLEIGSKLGKLHNSIQLSSAGSIKISGGEEGLDVDQESWKVLFRDLVWNFTGILEETDFEDLIEPMRKSVEENLEVLDNREEFCLLHCEMAPWNILGNEEEITGVLDWERSIAGDPEYDLFLTERFLSIPSPTTGELHERKDEIIETFYKGYRKEREIDEGWKDRRTLYRIANLAYQMWLIEGSEEELKRRWKKLKQEAENIEVDQ